ncbi:SDR family NAD(P)-dependent oxidoreductase [Nocardia sp. CA-120079]|uniref:SDR family NAD(P)-dependent oxidoreductase n=1 Tax=Nocardia sp. CA-120079 TaxID=3239974 RepID=UPI003D97A1E1
MNAKPVDSKVILVTGAANGIGAAITRAAIDRGHRVLVTDIDEVAAHAAAEALGARAAGFGLDVRDGTAWEKAFDAAEREFGTVDVLINNAGIIHTGKARDLTFEQHREMVEINLLGTMAGVYAGLGRMARNGRGHLITICSMSAFLPLAGYATYGGTKHAIRAFHHSVALEERANPLDFTIIHPPSTKTRMLEQELLDPTAATAFAEKPYQPERIAEVVVDAIATKPVEVVFPPIGGRIQRAAGAFPRFMRWVMPIVEIIGKKQQRRLLAARHGAKDRQHHGHP